MPIILGLLAVCFCFGLMEHIANAIQWARGKKRSETDRKRRQRESELLSIRAEENFYKNYAQNNLLVLKEELQFQKAYFKDGTVYAKSEYEDFIIGYFDEDGKVYSSDRYEIGSVTTSGDADELVSLNRYGDLKRHRQLLYGKDEESELTPKELEEYYALLRKSTLTWMCASVWRHGTVCDLKSGEELGKREISANESEQNAVGYGACFICLQYMSSNSGKYADFYCPLGNKYKTE